MGRFPSRAPWAFAVAGIGLCVAAAGWSGPVRAAGDDAAQLNGVVVGTFQHTGQSDARDEWGGSLDLAGQVPLGPGLLGAEIKANTKPRNRGVTGILGEANDTVGETLSRRGNGRVSAVQLFYALPLGPGIATAGLLDSTGILDSNAIADTEYTQFLGSSFVHNLTIEFPSFALGANYLWNLSPNWRLDFFFSSTAGLEDRSNPVLWRKRHKKSRRMHLDTVHV